MSLGHGNSIVAATNFHIMQVSPLGGSKTPFADIIGSLAWGLQELGHGATAAINNWRPGARHIVLCPHLLTDKTIASLPADTIFYNLEQIDPYSPLPPTRLEAFRNRVIWDYSPRNIAAWEDQGINAISMPIAWYPALERIQLDAEPTIDLLFYGVLNDRRIVALKHLADAGLNVQLAQHVFGKELDALIAQSKIVLNVHCYPASIFESARVSLLLANGVPVVSERSGGTEVPEIYDNAICWTPYEDLASASRKLLGSPDELQRLKEAGPETMRRNPVTPLLERALENSLHKTASGFEFSAKKTKIPRVLHVIWIGEDSQHPAECLASWQSHHPGATIRFWGREALASVPWFNRHHMEALRNRDPAMIMDLMRWEILYREGGIVVDASSYCLEALPEWLFECEMFACWENELARPGVISTAVVGSVPVNPFLFQMIHSFQRQATLVGRPAWEATGPMVLTSHYRRAQYSNLTILPSHFFVPRHYGGLTYSAGGPVLAEQRWPEQFQ